MLTHRLFVFLKNVVHFICILQSMWFLLIEKNDKQAQNNPIINYWQLDCVTNYCEGSIECKTKINSIIRPTAIFISHTTDEQIQACANKNCTKSIHANPKTLKSGRHFYETTCCSGWLKISVIAAVSVWQYSGISMMGYEDDGWQRMHYKNRLKQSVRCLIFVMQEWHINPFEFSNKLLWPSIVL